MWGSNVFPSTIFNSFSITVIPSIISIAVHPAGVSCSLCQCMYAQDLMQYTSDTSTVFPPLVSYGLLMIGPGTPAPSSPYYAVPQFALSPVQSTSEYLVIAFTLCIRTFHIMLHLQIGLYPISPHFGARLLL